jgi:hypothetical protein
MIAVRRNLCSLSPEGDISPLFIEAILFKINRVAGVYKGGINAQTPNFPSLAGIFLL